MISRFIIVTYKGPPTFPMQPFFPPPNHLSICEHLASYWFISQLASIILWYWSPVSPVEFNCFMVATPPSFLMLLTLLLTFSILLAFPLSLARTFFLSFLFSSHFLSYPEGRPSVCLISSLMWFPVSSVVFVGSLTLCKLGWARWRDQM